MVKALIMHLNLHRVHAAHAGGKVQACMLASARHRLGEGREAAEHSVSLSTRAEAMLLQEHTVACLSRHSGSRKWKQLERPSFYTEQISPLGRAQHAEKAQGKEEEGRCFCLCMWGGVAFAFSFVG